MAKDLAMKKKEEAEQMNKLEGRLQDMITKLQLNITPKEFTLAGINLGGPRTRILASNISKNTSLMILHMSRKSILDPEGVEIAKVLKENKTLRKIELEGNNLGPASAREFGNALMVNTTLRSLDLESNQLT